MTNIPYVHLNTLQVRSNHIYLYETLTAVFFHASMRHWFNNIIMAFLVLPDVEYMWCPSLLLALVAVATNMYVVLMFEGIFMGLSGMLSASLGIYIVYLISNWDFLSSRFDRTMYSPLLYIFFMTFMLFGDNWKTTSIHFIALGIGALMAFAFLPRHISTETSRFVSKVFMVMGLATVLIPLVVILAS